MTIDINIFNIDILSKYTIVFHQKKKKRKRKNTNKLSGRKDSLIVYNRSSALFIDVRSYTKALMINTHIQNQQQK